MYECFFSLFAEHALFLPNVACQDPENCVKSIGPPNINSRLAGALRLKILQPPHKRLEVVVGVGVGGWVYRI